MADKDLSALLAELGGDNPRNRAIAEGLFKQGINSTKDIEVRKVPVPGRWEGTDEASYYVPESTGNTYFNKATGKEINPERLGVYQVDKNGKAQGDIFFHLNADQNGNISFDPQWSPRAHGFLRDNAVGQAIMTAGKIIPSPFQPFFAAAGAIDAAAHGKYGQALASALPYAINELATGSDLLTNLRGADFNPVSATSAGNIAEALGVPGQYADLAGKLGSSEISNQLKGGPAGLGALTAGVGAGVQSGIGALGGALKGLTGFDTGVNPNDFDSAALNDDPTAVDLTLSSDDMRAGDLGTTNTAGTNINSGNITSFTPAQLQALHNQENPGAANIDLENADTVRFGGKEYFLDGKGGAVTQNPDGTYTTLNAEQLSLLGPPDVEPETNPQSRVTVTGKRDAGTATVNTDSATGDLDLTALNKPTSQTPAATTATTAKTALDTSQIPANTSQVAALSTGLSSLDTTQISALTTTQIAGLVTGAVAPAIVKSIVGGGDGGTTTQTPALTTGPTTLSTTQAPAVTSGPAVLTTTDVRGLQTLPTSDARYWRQTGAQGTGGKGGVKFFDWYDTPENRTMAPSTMASTTIPAITSQQAQAMATPAPTPKQYFNQSTNRYYTDPTGQWTPPAGWAQTTFKDGGDVNIKHFDGGGWALGFGGDSIDASGSDFGNDWGYGTTDADVNEYLRNLPSDNNSYGGGSDLTPAYQQDIVNAAGAGASSSGGSVLSKLLQLAKDNPNLTKLLAAAGIGGLLGYAGRPKPVAPMGMQGGSLGLTQSQVHNALKGVPVKRAEGGGIDGYAGGGGLHYLKSAEDGMADKISATIDNKQPAKLSGGEFVIPADVVSHLGNGNSEAGAKQLYDMMDRIRHARTGTKQQGKQINPAKFTPK